MMAYALEIDPALLAYVPELLTDLDVLGADADMIVEALGEVGVSEQSTVVDLGCGKGGVAIAAAAALGCSVVGVDLFAPFVDIARSAAERAGVGELCQFVQGGIGELSATIEPADAVVYAALGDVLGPLDATMAVIRHYAKPGGYVVVNDSYVREPNTATFPGFENYTDLPGTRRRLTTWGDELILELLERDNGDTDHPDEAGLLAARAAALANRHPHLASAFHDFARFQQNEYDYLDEHTGSAVWVVRRH